MSWDPIWENVFQNQAWGKYPSESLIRFMTKNHCTKKGERTKVLELGCGSGANVWYMAREGFDVYGIDGSRTAIEKAKNRMSAERLTVDLRVGDIVKLPYEDGAFDVVVDVECLSCNSEDSTKNILLEIKRVLKSAGMFFSQTATEDNYAGRRNNKIGDLEYDNVSDGPLHGKGLIRLINKESIYKLYGDVFTMLSLDKIEYTVDNGSIKISEWTILCKKNR